MKITTADWRNPTIGPYHEGLHGVNQPANIAFVQIFWASLGLLAATAVSFQIALWLLHSRRRAALADAPRESKQAVWMRPVYSWIPGLKRHLIYAPLFRLRRACRHPLFGSLPSRFHGMILCFYALSNIGYMLAIDFGNLNIYAVLAEFRGRTGTLAVANFVPLVLLIGRNNPITTMMRLNYDTCIMLHRWVGRIVVLEAILHGIAWAAVHVADEGWLSVASDIQNNQFVTAGFIGWVSLGLIVTLSLPPVRAACYEAFVDIHILLAITVFVTSLVHCELSGFDLPHIPWIIAAACLWGLERILRAMRLASYTFSRNGRASAVVEAIKGRTDVCRITLSLPRRVEIAPGTYAYVRLMAAKPWETHPFSIAWVEHKFSPAVTTMADETSKSQRGKMTTTVSFIVGAQRGFTRDLFRHAIASGDSFTTGATFEGPYDGHSSLSSFGHVVLFAGATGITNQLRHARQLVVGYNARTAAARRIVLVWIVRNYDAMEWIRPWLAQILRLPNAPSLLRVKVFVTREAPHIPHDLVLGLKSFAVLFERPNVAELLRAEVADQVGAMCVTVCGPGGLSDDVRAAVRASQSSGHDIDFEENGFSW
ncbi:Ferric reductase transmembrane component 3-like protein 1 [Colletotrichum plurivorum]|uniref:Ferric reductase transmembrane component 3-like protein 1 n=1 Tax=Colletotrichum plurivorum TaxID=2175906 RepID=A0A8H6JRI8_9PEZI|nr:Ferric reductase transmembrane component 3-like protein 1 [Colletotrichum plurivorum]